MLYKLYLNLTRTIYILCGVTLVIILGASIWLSIIPQQNEPKLAAYWLWGKVPLTAAPHATAIYLYQGDFTTEQGHFRFTHRGNAPHPVTNNNIHLVFRIEKMLPPAQMVSSVANSVIQRWELRGVHIQGIQIDYDSPTNKLLYYSNYLHDIRQQLPRQYALSVTALVDWVNVKDHHALIQMANVTDRIIFQLYNGNTAIPHLENYVQQIKNLSIPYSIGLLPKQAQSTAILSELQQAKNYHGIVYFIGS